MNKNSKRATGVVELESELGNQKKNKKKRREERNGTGTEQERNTLVLADTGTPARPANVLLSPMRTGQASPCHL